MDASITGDLRTISITTGTLTLPPSTDCATGASCFIFSTGTVTAMEETTTVFTSSLEGGELTRMGNAIAIAATLLPSSMVASGSVSEDFEFRRTTITRGNAGVQGAFVPEPSTLGLLGTGLIGLAGMARRKLKLPT